MKILHIIDSGGLYGAEIMLLYLMEEQHRKGLVPILASIGDCDCGEKPLELEAQKRGLRVEQFRMRPGPNILGAIKVLRFARERKIDILHSHGYKGNILFGLMPKSLRRIPMVTTLHGWTWTGGWNRMALYERLDRFSLYFIDRVVVVSENMKAKVGLKNLSVVNNGIPLDSSNATNSIDPTDPILAFCNGGYTIGAIGRLSPEKGYGILLKAIEKAVQSFSDMRLVILGEGSERGYLEAEVNRLGLTRRVLMPGYVDDANRYLPLFKVFALSSFTEGMPIVILEALRAGTPIVSTRVGGMADLIENGVNGVLVNPSDPNDLANGLLKYCQDEDLRTRLPANGKEIFRQKFSNEQMAIKYNHLYADCLHHY